MDQQRKKYREPKDTLWGKCLTTFIAIVFAMSTLTIIPIAGALDNPANEQADAAAAAAAKEAADEAEGKSGTTLTEETPKPIENLINEDKKGETFDTVENVLGDQSSDEDDTTEAVPAEVQAFLDAVAKLPAADAVTAENAEEIGNQINAVLDMADAMSDENYQREDVTKVLEEIYALQAAVLAVENVEDAEVYYTEPLPGKEAHSVFEYNGSPECYLYLNTHPNNPKASLTNPAEDMTVWVGEQGATQRLYTHSTSCDYCGNILHEESAEWIAVEPNKSNYFVNTNPDAIKNITWGLGGYAEEDASDAGYGGFPALQIGFTGSKPGTTTLNFLTWQEYYYSYYNQNGWWVCPSCWSYYDEIYFNGWVQDEETLNITVNARYELKYNSNGGSIVLPTVEDKADTSATLSVTGNAPSREGYTFAGWYEDQECTNPAKTSYMLNWSEGYGSTANPVSKTLYAKWTKTPTKEDLTVSKSPSEEYPVVGKEFTYTITVNNPNSQEIKVNITDALNEKLDFVAAGDGGTYDQATRTVTWADVTVPANGSKDVTVYVKANAAGEIYNEAKIKCEVNETSGNTTVTAKNPDSIKRTFKVIYYNESGENWMSVEDSAQKGFLNMPEWQKDEGVTENPHEMTVSTNVPTRDGYTFDHWQWGGDANSTFNPGDTITLTANPESLTEVAADLYAVWTKNPVKHTVTYTWSGLPDGHNETLPAGGSFAEGAEVDVDSNYVENKEVTVNGTTYVFSGWSVTEPSGITITDNKLRMPNTNVTISGTWSVKSTPELSITKAVSSDNVKVGDTVTYTITVKNTGNATATNVQIKDMLNAEYLEWQSASYSWTAPYDGPDDGMIHSNYAGTGIFSNRPADGMYSVDDMKPGAELTLTITAKATKAGTVDNTATVKGDNTPEKPSDKVTTIVTVPTHTVTVRYMCDVNNNSFTDTVNHTYTLAEGESYDHSVDPAVTTYPSADGFNSAVRSPLSFKTSPSSANTWVYDEVLTTDALTGTMGDKDIVIEVWYSQDNKGTIGTDGTDTSDGTPDKYQVKVTYKVVNGAWDDESTTDVVTYLEKHKGGIMAADGTATLGETIPAVGNKPASGYEVGSWNETPASSTTISSDAEYTYTYKLITYTISYVLDGGTVNGTNPATYTVESADITLTNPTREGYTFAGWTGTGLTGATTKVTIVKGSTGNRSYTATWNANGNTAYTVEHYQQNLDGTYSLAETENLTGATDSTVNATVKTYEGFTHNPNAAGTLLKSTVAGNGSTVLRVYYDRNTYTVGYDLNGGSVDEGVQTTFEGIKHGDTTPTIADPTRTGYTFAGWSPVVADTVTGDVTYVAQWTPVIFNIDVQVVNGTSDADTVGTNVNYGGDATYTFTPNEGYVLESVTVDGNPAALSADGTFTFNAVTRAHSIVVTYVAAPVIPTPTPEDPTPTPAVTTPADAAAPVAAAAAAAAVEAIGDAENPLAAVTVPEEELADDANAMAAFEGIHCWTHWLMIFGALVTIVYGLAVLYRRRHDVRDMDDFEGDIMDGSRRYSARQASDPAANGAFQAM